MAGRCGAGSMQMKEVIQLSEQPLLSINQLTKYFPIKKAMFSREPQKMVRAVDGVTFQLHRQEALGLIGESGCGKSTVARLILGLYKPTEGEILYKGQKLEKYGLKNYRKKTTMIFQDPYSSLDSRMNIRRIIEEPLRVHEHMTKQQKMDIVLPLLEKVGLPPDSLEKYPHQFSGGQRQRIGIARALATQPEIVVCDEPVSALDVSIQSSILNLFKDMQRDMGLSYLFISHDVSVIRHVCDRIAVMYLGHIVEFADKKELFDHTLHPYSEALMSAVPVPDPTKKKSRILLPGDPPSPISPPSGCPFRTRCPKAMPRCAEEKPVLTEVAPNHCVACHLFGDRGGASC